MAKINLLVITEQTKFTKFSHCYLVHEQPRQQKASLTSSWSSHKKPLFAFGTVSFSLSTRTIVSVNRYIGTWCLTTVFEEQIFQKAVGKQDWSPAPFPLGKVSAEHRQPNRSTRCQQMEMIKTSINH